MTQKELLYIEDAIGHEKNIISICEDTVNKISNGDIISFLENEIIIHKNMLSKLINKLEEKTNE